MDDGMKEQWIIEGMYKYMSIEYTQTCCIVDTFKWIDKQKNE